jgi:hypothetical protein
MCFEGEQILWLEDRETTMAALAIRNDVGPDDLRRQARQTMMGGSARG